MKKILALGAYEGSELMLYMARILVQLNKNVLIVDATKRQTYQVFNGSAADVPLFELDQIDIITDVRSWNEIEQMQKRYNENEEYDFVLIHGDHFLQSFVDADRYVLLSSYDKYVLDQNRQILHQFFQVKKKQVEFCHAIFHTDGCVINEQYISEMFASLPIVLDEEPLIFHNDELNIAVKYNNQFKGSILMHGLSRSYKKSLAMYIHELTEIEERRIIRAIKTVNRRKQVCR